jgi:C_GCAxxG_C_C family probable redox protein
MSKSDVAESYFSDGFSCSQAVLLAFSSELGVPENTATKVAEAFGGGLAIAETCGAVTGALMALGLKYGREEPADAGAKQETRRLTREFMEAFKAQHGTLVCRELLGVDISTPEGNQQANEAGLFKARCPIFVRSAVEIAEGLL